MYMKNKDERTSRAQHIHTHVQMGENILEMPSEPPVKTYLFFVHLSGPNKFSNIMALRYEP